MPKILIEVDIPHPLYSLFEKEGTLIGRSGPFFGSRLFRFKADTDTKSRIAIDCMLSHMQQIRSDIELEANGRRVDSEVIKESQLEEPYLKLSPEEAKEFKEWQESQREPLSITQIKESKESEGKTWDTSDLP